jgi:acetylornithine deacetylase
MMEQGIQEKIVKAVEGRRKEIVQFLQDLVRIPSPAGEERDVQAFVEKKLRDMKMELDVWEPDIEKIKRDPWFMGYPLLEKVGYKGRPVVVGVSKGSGGGKSLMLQGHVDVMPPGEAPWKYGPWSGTIEGDRLYGRGSSDMKAGVAAMIMALDCLHGAGFRLKGDIFIESVIDEETGGNGALACAQKGYRADAAIITEPTECKITAACEGFVWTRVKVKGRAAHAAVRHQGVCAIEKGMKIFQAIKDLEAYREQKVNHPAFDRSEYPFIVPLMVGIFNAGISRGIVAAEANLECRVGFVPGEDPMQVYQEFCDQVRKAAELDPWLREHLPQVEIIGIPIAASEIPMDHPIIESLKRCQRLVIDEEPKVNGIPMGTEQHIIIERAQTACAVFGPGSPSTAHATDECLDPLEDLIVATKTLALTLADWCGTK